MKSPLETFAVAPPSIENVEAWHAALVADGRISADKARLRRTALRRMWSARDPATAVNDATWMQSHLDELQDRLVANGIDLGTARTYKSRSASALSDFIRYRVRPDQMRGSRRKRDVSRVDAPERSEVRLDHGRSFRYELPRAFTRRDLQRVYLHLLALVEDLDSAGPVPGPVQLQLGLAPAAPTKGDDE